MGVDFESVDASDDLDVWYELEKLSGITPTIIWDDGRIEIGWKGEFG